MDYDYNNGINLQGSGFFESLPVYLKESIMQSGIDFRNEDELRAFVAKYEYNITD